MLFCSLTLFSFYELNRWMDWIIRGHEKWANWVPPLFYLWFLSLSILAEHRTWSFITVMEWLSGTLFGDLGRNFPTNALNENSNAQPIANAILINLYSIGAYSHWFVTGEERHIICIRCGSHFVYGYRCRNSHFLWHLRFTSFLAEFYYRYYPYVYG